MQEAGKAANQKWYCSEIGKDSYSGFSVDAALAGNAGAKLAAAGGTTSLYPVEVLLHAERATYRP